MDLIFWYLNVKCPDRLSLDILNINEGDIFEMSVFIAALLSTPFVQLFLCKCLLYLVYFCLFFVSLEIRDTKIRNLHP